MKAWLVLALLASAAIAQQSVVDSIANYDPNRLSREKQAADQAREQMKAQTELLRLQTEEIRQRTEALRIENEKRQRQLSLASSNAGSEGPGLTSKDAEQLLWSLSRSVTQLEKNLTSLEQALIDHGVLTTSDLHSKASEPNRESLKP